MLERVNLYFFKVFKRKFSKFKLLVLICVKVERSGVFSEGVTSTTGFAKKWANLSLNVPKLARLGAWCLQYVMCIKMMLDCCW